MFVCLLTFPKFELVVPVSSFSLRIRNAKPKSEEGQFDRDGGVSLRSISDLDDRRGVIGSILSSEGLK